MKNLKQVKIMKASLLSLFLVLSTGCVVSSRGVHGDIGVDVLPPQIVTSDNSFVSVRVGPGFYASDAYLLAYDYCLNRGLYAYEFSPWAHSASVVRDLRYDCRPSYIAPPMVYHVDRSNRFRYNYFRNYYRNHRPGYHYTRPSSGWWGRNNNNNSTPSRGWWGRNNNNNNSNVPREAVPTNPSPRFTRDGRATTPSSPWSHNPDKNRYQPRNNSGPASSSPSKPGWWGRNNSNNSQPSAPNTSPSKPGWFGGNGNSSRPSVSAPTPLPKVEDSKPRSGFWGGSNRPSKSSIKPESSSSSPRYSAPRSDRSNDIKTRDISSPSRPSMAPSNRFEPRGSSSPSRGSGSSPGSSAEKYTPKWMGK